MRTFRTAVAVGAVAASAALLAIGVAGSAGATTASDCTANVGDSGLSAAVVAHAGQTIAHRRINAAGCDIGIYVGAGVSHVKIDAVTVTGANFEGIFAERTSHLTVEKSTISGNGLHTIDPSAPALPGSGLHSKVGQSFAISLFGVSRSTVRGNTLTGNGRGGIGIMDNGSNDPGTITQNTSAPVVSSTHDVVINNRMRANYNGCALVVATQNLGGTLSDMLLADNTIVGTGMSKNGPDVGGIVVAADLPNSTVSNVVVSGNSVTDSFEGGVIVNAEAAGSSTTNVVVTGNTLSGNNTGKQEAPRTAGAIVFAGTGARNVATVLMNNTITRQYYGIWSSGNDRPVTVYNHIRPTRSGTAIHHA